MNTSNVKSYTIKIGVIGDGKLQKFQRDLDKIARSAKRTRQAVERTGKSMNALGAVASRAAFALAAVFSVAQIKASLDFADAIGKTSTQLGVAAETLQVYRYAADLAGVSATQLDTGLQKLSKSIGEALVKGTGTGADAFKALGLNLRDASGNIKSNETVFEEFAQKISQIESPAIQASLAMDIFGRSGVKLLPMLQSGAAGMDEMRKEAERLGLVMSEETVRGAEELNDRMTTMTTIARVQLTTAFVAVGQQILKLVDGFDSFQKALAEGSAAATVLAIALGTTLVAAILKASAALVALALSNPFTALALVAVAAVVLIIANWDKLAAWFTLKLPSIVDRVISDFNYLAAEVLTAMEPIVVGVAKIFDDLYNIAIKPALELIVSKMRGLTAEVANATGSEMLGALSGKLLEFETRLSTPLNNAGAAAGLMGESISNAIISSNDAFNRSEAYAKEYAATIADINKETEKAATDTTNFNTALDDTVVAAGSAGSALADVKPEITELEKAMDSFAQSSASALEDGIINAAKGAKDAFKDMAMSILEDLARMIIRLNVTIPLMNALKGAGGGGGFLGSLFPSNLGNYFPKGVANSAPLNAYALGGIIGTRTVVGNNLIGESGPEAVLPLRRHNGRMGVEASAVTVNVIDNGNNNVEVNESTGNDGGRTIDILIEQKVKNSIGSGAMDRSMRARYGIRPVGG